MTSVRYYEHSHTKFVFEYKYTTGGPFGYIWDHAGSPILRMNGLDESYETLEEIIEAEKGIRKYREFFRIVRVTYDVIYFEQKT
jgi:hypothetical protein